MEVVVGSVMAVVSAARVEPRTVPVRVARAVQVVLAAVVVAVATEA